MPLSEATITYDFSDLLGADLDSRRTKVWATTNAPYVIDTDGNEIRLGSGAGTIATDGTGSIVVWVPGVGSNPASWQTTVHIDYPDRAARGGRGTKAFGPFTVTVSADLADLVDEMPVLPEYASDVLDRLDALEEGGGGGGSSALIVVSGGTVDLDNTKADGFLVGYKVTATTAFEGVDFAAGSYIFERDSGVTSGWTYRTLAESAEVGEAEPAGDTTDPTAGTLSATTTATTADLLVSGAMDETALHATPYRYSKDDGSTWTAWQSGATYQFTGLTSATSYPFKHEVRDAALNVKTGAAVTVATSALLAWSTLIHEVTTRANAATVVTGTAPETTTGGATFTASSTFTSNGTQLVSAGTGGVLDVAYSDTASTKTYRVSVDYDVSAQSADPNKGTASTSLHVSGTGQVLGIKVASNGAVTLVESTVYTYTTTVVNAVTAGLTGTIKAEIDTTNGTVRGYHNSTHVFTAVCDATLTFDTFKAAWQAGWGGLKLGNLKLEVYQ